MRFLCKAMALFFALALTGCDDGYLRGSVTPSKDGLTYLAVIDDNGGHCGHCLWMAHDGNTASVRQA
jgi:hypothetical protein